MALEKVLTKERGDALRAQGWWKDKTINDYFEDALRRFPDKPAILGHLHGGGIQQRMSYRELDGKIGVVAASLRRLGVRQGDVVSMQVPNTWEFIVVAIAASRVGAVVNPLMPILRERELSFMLEYAESKVFVVCANYRGFDHAAMARGMLANLPNTPRLVVVGEDSPDGFEQLLLSDVGERVEATQGALQPDDVALLMFSSGTTGAPKGVMHTSNTLLSTMLTSMEDLRLDTEDVVLAFSPFGHLTGYALLIMLPLMCGNTIVTMDIWNAQEALDLIRTEQVTYSCGATPFLSDFVSAVETGYPTAPSFKLFACAGAPIPSVLIERATTQMGLTVCSIWGMTECAAGSFTHRDVAQELSSMSDGKAVRGNELKVVDEQGASVAIGVTGRLLMRGSSLFVGYLKRPDLNAIDTDGWFDTGDMAYVLNDEGYIRINGRSKDVIIRGGENIPVFEIESLLLRHPAVAAVSIVGYPDERLGERACAFVVLKSDQTFDLQAMQVYLHESKTAKQYWPERVVISSDLPRTASGKVQKFRLREQVITSGTTI